MTISAVIDELQKRLEMHGDSEVIFRDADGDEDISINAVYYDEDAERAVVSNQEDFWG